MKVICVLTISEHLAIVILFCAVRYQRAVFVTRKGVRALDLSLVARHFSQDQLKRVGLDQFMHIFPDAAGTSPDALALSEVGGEHYRTASSLNQ
jgi:hypothetical protein